MPALETTPALLREHVERFRVCWESRPEYLCIRGERRQIGFVLELAGTHEAGVEHPEPGCEHCQRVFAALREIAEWILLGKDGRHSTTLAPMSQRYGIHSQTGSGLRLSLPSGSLTGRISNSR